MIIAGYVCFFSTEKPYVVCIGEIHLTETFFISIQNLITINTFQLSSDTNFMCSFHYENMSMQYTVIFHVSKK